MSESERPAPGLFQSFAFDGPSGARPYKLYVPSRSEGTAMPLVVMLHGCTQSPDDFAAGTRMNDLAEQQGLLVCYPGQDDRGQQFQMLELVQRGGISGATGASPRSSPGSHGR